MAALIALGSIVLILIVLIDAFETMLLPRRVRRQYRFARVFYVYSWDPWAAMARQIRSDKRRNTLLSLFGPLSIIVLIAIWAVAMIMGFALLHWAIGTPLGGQDGAVGLGTYAYFSGVTFFTLGYGDVTPVGPPGRFLAVVETGTGFGFLALVISYLPVLYQAFSGARSQSRCWMRAPGRHPRPERCWAAWPGSAISSGSTSSSASGNAGRPRYWKVRSRSPC